MRNVVVAKELDSVMPKIKSKADKVRLVLNELEKTSDVLTDRIEALEKKAKKIEAKYRKFKKVVSEGS